MIKKCVMCNGTGKVATMGKVYPGEPQMADVDDLVDCLLCDGTGEVDDEGEEEDDDDIGGVGVLAI